MRCLIMTLILAVGRNVLDDRWENMNRKSPTRCERGINNPAMAQCYRIKVRGIKVRRKGGRKEREVVFFCIGNIVGAGWRDMALK